MALMHVDFFSNVLGMCVQMDVILPQKTAGQIGMEGAAGESFPTLYLLHGMSDDHTIWQRRTSIERYVADKNLAVVMPSTGLGWYTDTTYGLRYQTYISQELPAICRSFFKGMSDKREDTFVAGLSMGGYGAFKAAFTAPETFGKAASLSGALDLPTSALTRATETMPYWEGIFGPLSQVENSKNDLAHLAAGCKARGADIPKLYACCGTEDFLFQNNRNFLAKMDKLDIPVTWTQGPGVHNWDYWDQEIQPILAWLLEGRE